MQILLIVRDTYNDIRTGIFHGFGRALSRLGHDVTLAAVPIDPPAEKNIVWEGGRLLLAKPVSGGVRAKLAIMKHDIVTLLREGKKHGVWVFRDKIFLSLFAIALGKIYGRKVVYWYSFPFPESDLARLAVSGKSIPTLKRLYLHLRGRFSGFVLYCLVLRWSDHILAVSDKLKEELAKRGIPGEKITPYPLCVDKKLFESIPEPAEKNNNSLTIGYLGVVSRLRRMDFTLDVFKKVLAEFPDAKLLLIGGALNNDERTHMNKLIQERALEQSVVWTGHLPQLEALRMTKHADVCIIALEQNWLYDISSPTKVVEYLALGIPAVSTPVPDSVKILAESGGGYWAAFDVEAFSDAVLRLARDPGRKLMGERGKKYVFSHRTYEVMAEQALEPALKSCYTEPFPK